MEKKLCLLLIFLSAIILAGCGEDGDLDNREESYSDYESTSNDSTYSKDYSSDSSYDNSVSKSIEHYCEADGCYKEGTMPLEGFSGEIEYYCYTHYKELEDMVNDMIDDTYSSSSFTNKTGTSTTKCMHSGCDNYIAPSGDTYFCITHSKNCGVCGCYIDEDAMYCPSCIIDAFTQ